MVQATWCRSPSWSMNPKERRKRSPAALLSKRASPSSRVSFRSTCTSSACSASGANAQRRTMPARASAKITAAPAHPRAMQPPRFMARGSWDPNDAGPAVGDERAREVLDPFVEDHGDGEQDEGVEDRHRHVVLEDLRVLVELAGHAGEQPGGELHGPEGGQGAQQAR